MHFLENSVQSRARSAPRASAAIMTDQIEQLLSGSDFQIFGDLFGNFELYMPDLSDEETAKDPGPDINMLLSLPVNENYQKLSPVLRSIPPDSEASTPFLEDQKNHGLQPSTQHTDSELPLNSELKPEAIKSERFKKLTATELDEMRDNKYAQKTKSNTKWGVNLFQG